ncbi:MAG: AraC family transcriptional regulator [Terrimicrobiaceae bacterium]
MSHFGEYVLDRNHVVPFHSHATWELVLQAGGSSTWTEGSLTCQLEQGDLLICPPGVPHGKAHRGPSEFRIYFAGLQMDPERWPALRPLLSQKHMVRIGQAGEIAKNFRILEDELLSKRPQQQEGVELAWKQLWLGVYRLACSPKRTWDQADRWLTQRVESLVEEQPGERWTLQTMARLMGYSPNHFASLFKQQTGQTFHQYLLDARIETAKAALRLGEQTLTEIALQSGFGSSQHFSAAFCRKTGTSPSRWKSRQISAKK